MASFVHHTVLQSLVYPDLINDPVLQEHRDQPL